MGEAGELLRAATTVRLRVLSGEFLRTVRDAAPGEVAHEIGAVYDDVHLVDRLPLREAERALAARHPVLLVGGVDSAPHWWRHWAATLEADGFQPWVLDLAARGRAPLADDIEAVRQAIDAVLGLTGADGVHLVGHSKGGVAVLAAADALRGNEVLGVTVIASPLRGVGPRWFGRLAGRSKLLQRVVPQWVRDLTRGSRMLERPATFQGPVTSIAAARFDGIVSPAAAHGSRPGVRFVEVPAGDAWFAHGPMMTTNRHAYAEARDALLRAESAR